MKRLIFSMITLLSLVMGSNLLATEHDKDKKEDVKKDEEMEEEKEEAKSNRLDLEF